MKTVAAIICTDESGYKTGSGREALFFNSLLKSSSKQPI